MSFSAAREENFRCAMSERISCMTCAHRSEFECAKDITYPFTSTKKYPNDAVLFICNEYIPITTLPLPDTMLIFS